MSIIVRLDRLLYERQLSLTELSGRVGVTVANLSILKTGKARAIRFSTLEAICRELGCQPGELLEYLDPGDDRAAGQSGRGRPAARRQLEPGGSLGGG